MVNLEINLAFLCCCKELCVSLNLLHQKHQPSFSLSTIGGSLPLAESPWEWQFFLWRNVHFHRYRWKSSSSQCARLDQLCVPPHNATTSLIYIIAASAGNTEVKTPWLATVEDRLKLGLCGWMVIFLYLSLFFSLHFTFSSYHFPTLSPSLSTLTLYVCVCPHTVLYRYGLDEKKYKRRVS